MPHFHLDRLDAAVFSEFICIPITLRPWKRRPWKSRNLKELKKSLIKKFIKMLFSWLSNLRNVGKVKIWKRRVTSRPFFDTFKVLVHWRTMQILNLNFYKVRPPHFWNSLSISRFISKSKSFLVPSAVLKGSSSDTD